MHWLKSKVKMYYHTMLVKCSDHNWLHTLCRNEWCGLLIFSVPTQTQWRDAALTVKLKFNSQPLLCFYLILEGDFYTWRCGKNKIDSLLCDQQMNSWWRCICFSLQSFYMHWVLMMNLRKRFTTVMYTLVHMHAKGGRVFSPLCIEWD